MPNGDMYLYEDLNKDRSYTWVAYAYGLTTGIAWRDEPDDELWAAFVKAQLLGEIHDR